MEVALGNYLSSKMVHKLEYILKSIMDGITEGLIVINPDYKVVYVSPVISQLVGQKKEEIQNKFCFQILRQKENPCEGMTHRCPLKAVIESGKQFQSLQRYLDADKEEVPFKINCYPLKDENEKVIQIICVLKNLNELDKAKSELGRIHRYAAMGELFHGIAHNLNTPLSAVMARGEMLLERLKKVREEDGARESSLKPQLDKNLRDAEVVVSNAVKLSGIIRNMMQKGIQEGEENPQMLNLSYLLKEELQFLESDMKFKHEIKKDYFLDDSIPYIKGIYSHFSQSFINIIRNVMECIEQSEVKELSITTRYAENNIYIEIRDTGIKAKKMTQGGQPSTPGEMRLAQVQELLQPYNAEMKIRNKSHDNLYTIRIPYDKIREKT